MSQSNGDDAELLLVEDDDGIRWGIGADHRGIPFGSRTRDSIFIQDMDRGPALFKFDHGQSPEVAPGITGVIIKPSGPAFAYFDQDGQVEHIGAFTKGMGWGFTETTGDDNAANP